MTHFLIVQKISLIFLLLFSISAYGKEELALTQEEKIWIKNNKTIEVAVESNQKPIEFMHQNSPRGIGWEYLNYISKKTGLHFTAKVFSNIKESEKALSEGKVELVSGSFLEFKEDDFVASKPYMYANFSLVMRKDEVRDFSIMYMNAKRFAYLPTYKYHEQVKANYKEIDFMKSNNVLEVLHSIRDFHTDITVLPSVVARYMIETEHMDSLEIVDVGYKSQPITFIAQKNKEILISIIDKVITTIPRRNKFQMRKKWTHDLLYFSDRTSNKLTEEDLKYLRANQIIRYSGDPSWLPFEAFDESGKYIGIVAEYIRELEKDLNIKFVKVPTSSWEESVQLLKDGKIDMLSETTESSLKNEFIMTNSYLSNPIGIVMKKDQDYVSGLNELQDKKIAMVKGYGYVETIKKNFPQINFVYVKNTKEGLKQVSNGDIDGFVCTYAMADYQINHLGLDHIRVIGSTQYQTNLAFAVSPKLSSFVSILNKAISHMTVEDREKIIKKWIKHNAVIRIDYTLAWVILIFSFLILSVVLYSNKKFRKENKQRKEVQERLEILNERFETISDNIEGMIYESYFSLDGKNKALYISSGCKNLFGVEIDVAMQDFNVLYESVEEEDLNILTKLIQEASMYNVQREWTGRIKVDNKTKWLKNSFTSRKTKEGLMCFDGFVIDITREKEAEVKLEENREFIQAILNSQEQIIVITDGTKIDTVNSSFLEFFNFKSLAEFTQKYDCICNIFDEDSPSEFIRMHKDNELWVDYIMNRPNEVHKTQFEMNNKKMIFSVTASQLKENSKYIVAVFSDITELENTQKTLGQAKVKAEESDKAKSEFLANMSHEIRTPMNAVIGFTELLENTELEVKQRKYLESIKAGSKSLLRLINDILDLSKIEAGKIEIKHEVISLFSLAKDIEQIFEPEMHKKNISFEFYIDENIPQGLYLDETRLRQVLFNLLGNATKFTDKGKISITFKQTACSDTSEVDLEICVKDTGIGIAEAQQKKVFNSFEQQDGQSTRKYGGTGLGLSISKKLVTMMNGELSLESEEGKGSVFCIHLYKVKIGKLKEILDDSSVLEFKHAKVLIVDDILDNLYLAQESLSFFGLESVLANNGKEAIDVLRSTKIDLVLMDINMPVMDGYEAIKIIKNDEKMKELPIIALSASVMKEEKEKAVSNGFDYFLEKPISQKDFAKALSYFIEYKKLDKPKEELGKDINLEFEASLREELKSLFLQRCKDVLGSGMFDQMSTLSSDISSFATKKEISELKQWTQSLDEAIESFDIDAINDKFNLLIGELS